MFTDPDTNVGMPTGYISGVTVVDCDSEDAYRQLREFLPDDFKTPICKTPNGWHVHFKYDSRFGNAVRVNGNLWDIRNDGGFVVVPPSHINGSEYTWEQDSYKLEPIAMPSMLLDILLNSTNIYKSVNVNRESGDKKTVVSSRQVSSSVVKNTLSFTEGSRDNDIFHVANCLTRGGADPANIRIVLNMLASQCEPPFPESEVEIKIESATRRNGKSLTDAVRELVLSSSGVISSSYVAQFLCLSSRVDKQNVSKILSRMITEGLLERTKRVAGEYRIVDHQCEAEDWRNTESETVKIWLPFELDEIVEVMPGDIILIMGSQNAGKSAMLMNIAKENRDEWKTHYFSSELRAAGFKRRMAKFPDLNLATANINFYRRCDNWADVIKPGKGNLNIIDYVEMHDSFYKIAGILAEMHEKLDGAILIAAVQKDPNQLFGRGGSFTQEKPVLSLSLDNGTCVIAKCKEWAEGKDNPNRMEYKFKLVDGCRIIRTQGWHKPFEED
jgi:hypothetical protein